jgi:hypothetical protein
MGFPKTLQLSTISLRTGQPACSAPKFGVDDVVRFIGTDTPLTSGQRSKRRFMRHGKTKMYVPGTGQRLYAISHRHDGDVWFVTAGKTLTGLRPVWKRDSAMAFGHLFDGPTR